MQFKFAAFADESSPDLSGQIDALKRNGFDYLEIRNVNGKNVSDLTLAEAKEIAARLGDQGLSVKSLGSPIGKIPVDGDYAAHLDLYKHTLDLAGTFGADKIRLFSFYIPKGMDPAACRDTVLRRMEDFVVLAKPHGITACHENEKGIYGDIASRCLDIHENVPGLAAVFDPANFIQCGQDTLEGWELLHSYVNYMHIKDALPNGSVVPPGEGIGNVPLLLEKFAARGGQLLSLEPHLSDFVGLKNLEREGEESIVGTLSFPSHEAAFDHAAMALKRLLG